MKFPRVRFTIRDLMIAVMVIAGLLAVPFELRVVVAALSIPATAPMVAMWLVRRGYYRAAELSFLCLAILANIAIAATCIVPAGWPSVMVMELSFIVIGPALLAFGAAWALLSTQRSSAPLWLPWTSWALALTLSTMPFLTSVSFWPMRLTFLASRSEMNVLARQIVTGQFVVYPQWIGPFRVNGSRVDPATGNVALLTDTNPNHPAGFIRDMGGRPFPGACFSPIRGDALHVDFWNGWCYHVED